MIKLNYNIDISQKKLNRLIKTAIINAKKSEGRCRHVSLLLYGGKIVSIGTNLLKTDTFAYKLYKYAYIHSELAAIKKCPHGIPIEDCKIFNFRLSKNSDRFLMCKPCHSCTKLIDAYGIKEVYYTDNNNNLLSL